MFGFWEAILAYLTRQIGLRTDAADPAGSLHAKVKEGRDTIYNYLTGTINPKITPLHTTVSRFVAGNYTYGSWRTVASITGNGFLTGVLVVTFAAPSAGSAMIKITIDGVDVLSDDTLSFSRAGTQYSYGHGSLSMFHRFNNSLIVSVYPNDQNCHVFLSYILS